MDSLKGLSLQKSLMFSTENPHVIFGMSVEQFLEEKLPEYWYHLIKTAFYSYYGSILLKFLFSINELLCHTLKSSRKKKF